MAKTKVCKKCNSEKNPSDFILGNEKCYKCVYSEKLKLIKKSRFLNCLECGSRLHKSRWKYCSKKCSDKKSGEKRKEHWTRKVNVPKNTFSFKSVRYPGFTN